MHYGIRCEVTNELKKTSCMKPAYFVRKYKDDERIFTKKESKEKLMN